MDGTTDSDVDNAAVQRLLVSDRRSTLQNAARLRYRDSGRRSPREALLVGLCYGGDEMSSIAAVTGHLGGYEVVAPMSSGGMGEVILARRRGAHGFEKLVAIKAIRADLQGREELRTMFLDEARLAARLDHPAIAHVYDFGEQDGRLYLAMEYVSGLPFGDVINELRGPMPPGVAARAIAEVCSGLHAAHELCDLDGRSLAVVHRDISPQNLVLTFDGDVKILDFGIALMRDRQTPDTAIGVVKGKPAYLSPEQLDSQIADRRSDIYSVSAVLHELLTGKRLFDQHSIMEIAMAIQKGAIPSPSESGADCTGAVPGGDAWDGARTRRTLPGCRGPEL